MTELNTKCPICKKKSMTEYRPFCSKKCADIDLGHWFTGTYRIASAPKNEEEEQEIENFLKERLD
ncbi:DNA gyrase inhibitor YacG [Commensalibacter oyaizuii]|uniref:DNA gyrase inhibitor YacG n=1 Tax=Commensalibacter oyaizuii TaxID=3043873 RepID=A0ABT6Q2X7_9PROT|nr:DNA gyrase inhibitor YacG [Commensalibacter sp. TBRC 16381]MDI2091471.1 DNA gyrase inhibitor YacG [Commensalibacter sp. TBRC 16381]